MDNSGARSIEGTGIGLAIVAEAARAMGGTASATSEVGAGSAFEVRLPLVRASQPAGQRWAPHAAVGEALARESVTGGHRPRPHAPSGPSRRRPDRSILVAEDNPAMRARLSRVLAELGEVVTAPDGRAALDLLRERRFDLVVTDVMMPELDGLGLLKEIRADELLRQYARRTALRAGRRRGRGRCHRGRGRRLRGEAVHDRRAARAVPDQPGAGRLPRRREAASRVRSALLAGVSHDMQTPLAVISSTLELLSAGDMSVDAAQHIAARARARTLQLTQLVTQFLDWSRLSMNEPLPIRVTSHDLRDLAEHVASEHDQVHVTGDPHPIPAACDRQRTEQILHNLVDNAARSARTSIRIRLDAGETVLVARVIDDGAGISGRDPAPALRGVRPDGRPARQRPRAARLPRGGASPGRRPGAGVHRARGLRLRTHRSEGHAMKVLVADDDEDIRELSAHLFGRRGWVVTTVSNGEEAMEALVQREFDVAVLDQNMPPGSGLEVAAARREAGDRMPIVLWTGWGGLIDRAEAERLDVQVVNKAEVSSLAGVIADLGEPGDPAGKPVAPGARLPRPSDHLTSAPAREREEVRHVHDCPWPVRRPPLSHPEHR